MLFLEQQNYLSLCYITASNDFITVATGCAAWGFVAASTFLYKRFALVQHKNKEFRPEVKSQASKIGTLEDGQWRTEQENERLHATVAVRDTELKVAKWQLGRLPKLLSDTQHQVKKLQSQLADMRSDVEDCTRKKYEERALQRRDEAVHLKHEQWDKRMMKAREELQVIRNEVHMLTTRSVKDRGGYERLKALTGQLRTERDSSTAVTRPTQHQDVHGSDRSAQRMRHDAPASTTVAGKINAKGLSSAGLRDVLGPGFDLPPLDNPMLDTQTSEAEDDQNAETARHKDQNDAPDEHEIVSAARAGILPLFQAPEQSDAGCATASQGCAPTYSEIANLLEPEWVSEDAISAAIECRKHVNIAHLLPLFDDRMPKTWWQEIRASLETAELIDKTGNLVTQKRCEYSRIQPKLASSNAHAA